MGAAYIYRLDDITSDMNWDKFWKFIDLFKKYNVVPLLGVVPDNQDDKLKIQQKDDKFWDILKYLVENGMAEVAQHGYQHKLQSCSETIKGEFSGRSFEDQLNDISKGQNILISNGLFTDTWMAPCHSFDEITLAALKELGFKFITDGEALFPFKRKNLLFIPQQIWRPRWFPFGIFTICIHTNHADDELFELVVAHLNSRAKIIPFSKAKEIPETLHGLIANFVFKFFYKIAKALKPNRH